MALKLLTAVLSADLLAGDAKEPPKSFRLFRHGENDTTQGTVLFTERSAREVLEHRADYQNDVLIDYRHQARKELALDPAEAGKAAGWCGLEVRPNGELWAKGVEWTPAATEMIRAKEYRYFSPSIVYDEETREIVALEDVALTNRPAMKGITPLMLEHEGSSATQPPTPTEPRMKALLLALGLPETATEAEAVQRYASAQLSQSQLLSLAGVKDMASAVSTVAAWKAAADQLTVTQKRVTELEAEGEKAKKAALLEKGKKEGRIPPALEPFLSTLAVAQLEDYLTKAPAVGVAAPPKKEETTPATSTLTLEEKTVAAQMGLSEEAYIKAKGRRGSVVEKSMNERTAE